VLNNWAQWNIMKLDVINTPTETHFLFCVYSCSETMQFYGDFRRC